MTMPITLALSATFSLRRYYGLDGGAKADLGIAAVRAGDCQICKEFEVFAQSCSEVLNSSMISSAMGSFHEICRINLRHFSA